MLNHRVTKIIALIGSLVMALVAGWLVNGPAKMDAKGAEIGAFYITAGVVAGLFVLVNLVMLRRKGGMSQTAKTILAHLATAVIAVTFAVIAMYLLIQGAVPMNAQAWGAVVGGIFGLAAITALSTIDRQPAATTA